MLLGRQQQPPAKHRLQPCFLQPPSLSSFQAWSWVLPPILCNSDRPGGFSSAPAPAYPGCLALCSSKNHPAERSHCLRPGMVQAAWQVGLPEQEALPQPAEWLSQPVLFKCQDTASLEIDRLELQLPISQPHACPGCLSSTCIAECDPASLRSTLPYCIRRRADPQWS